MTEEWREIKQQGEQVFDADLCAKADGWAIGSKKLLGAFKEQAKIKEVTSQGLLRNLWGGVVGKKIGPSHE